MPDLYASQEELKKFISYCPATGRFKKKNQKYSQNKNAECCSSIHRPLGSVPYRRITLDYKIYSAHRLAWLYMYGYLPKRPYVIDHINGDGQDNRIENLRCVLESENLKNKRISFYNKSGITGVHWSAISKKWRAMICVNRKAKHLGLFKNIEDAAKARKDAEIQYGFHENHGRKVQSNIRLTKAN